MSNLFYEYTSAANPELIKIPIKQFSLALLKGNYGWIPFDLSLALNIPYPATGPSVLAGYLHVQSNTTYSLEPDACAVFCYVIAGNGRCHLGETSFTLSQGDVLSLPGNAVIEFQASNSDLVLYTVNDSPLLQRLNAAPIQPAFTPLHYEAAAIKKELAKIDAEAGAHERNRDGLIYANSEVTLGRGMSPSIWAATVQVAAGEEAMPHRHNSIAVDMVLECAPGAFSRLGWQLDASNQIIDPIEVPWESGAVFVTPPGIWHSHHNKTNTPAIVTAVQDATLHEYLHTLDIQFTHKVK